MNLTAAFIESMADLIIMKNGETIETPANIEEYVSTASNDAFVCRNFDGDLLLCHNDTVAPTFTLRRDNETEYEPQYGIWTGGRPPHSIISDAFDGIVFKIFFTTNAFLWLYAFCFIHELTITRNGKAISSLCIWMSAYRVIDELFFDPTAPGLNDYLFFVLFCIIAYLKYQKITSSTGT